MPAPLIVAGPRAAVVENPYRMRVRWRRAAEARFWLPGAEDAAGLSRMGIKYLPTKNDLRAGQRHRERENALSRVIKGSRQQPPKKRGKK